MSKKHDRYKEDYVHTDPEALEEMEVEHFEKFRPKKKESPKSKDIKKTTKDE